MKILENCNKNAIKICDILQQAGFQSFIVGGCVRDLILNLIPKDFDICTNATPKDIISIFPNNYPTGLQHGTITVSMGQGVDNHFEITTFRTEGEYTDGRRPDTVIFVNSIEEDLSRRDLTINAIAFDPINNKLIDPFHGQIDIKNKIIKAVGNPNLRFQEDGLRIMRAARFAARFGYEIDDSTMIGMKNNIDILKLISKERINDELSKTLMTDNPQLGLQILYNCGALQIACPTLSSNPYYMHFINSKSQYEGDLETRLAFIYSMMPNDLIKKELIDLKYSNKEIKTVIFLLELSDAFGTYFKSNQKSDYIQFIAKLKNASPNPTEDTYNQFITLMRCIGYDVAEAFIQHKDCIVWSRTEMSIDGNDILALGIKSGPEIKRILNCCYEEILLNPEHNTNKYLIEFTKNLPLS